MASRKILTAKRRALTLDRKAEVLQLSSTLSAKKISEQFGVGKTQIQSIIKRKAEVLEEIEKGSNREAKRLKFGHSHHEELENAVFEWFTRKRAMNMAINGPIIQAEALRVAKELNISSFSASQGWLSNFKKRHNICAVKLSGERASVDPVVVEDYKKRLPLLLHGYDMKDIFNCDETGILFRAMPDRSLHVRGDDAAGGKKSKERLTLLLCVNAVGDFEKPLVIGKAARPRCFKGCNMQKLPVTWTHNKKAWMTSRIFQDWLNSLNSKMARQGRKILLLLDNAPSHPHDVSYTNVKLLFMPSNTTSVLQPLDQGIIATVKRQYQQRLLNFVILKAESMDGDVNSVHKSIDVHLSITWMSEAISACRPETVSKCFRRTGVSEDTVGNEATVGEESAGEGSEDEDDIPLAQLFEKAVNGLKLKDPITFNEFISSEGQTESFEDNPYTAPTIQEDNEESEDDDSDFPTALQPFHINEMLDTLRRHFNATGMEKSSAAVMALWNSYEKESTARRRQSTIDNYFKRDSQ